MASAIPILGHDNVSTLSADRQDLLCVAATGDSHLARSLYSDADLFAVDFQPVSTVINGVEIGALRTDLIRRAVAHYLLKPDAYLTDAEVLRRWSAVHGQALGWLLDVLCGVLAAMEAVPAPVADSLPDFAWVLACLDSLWGTSSLELWRGGQGALYRELAEDDPVVLAISEAVTGAFQGSAKALLARLEAAHALPLAAGRGWTPYQLSRRLDRAQAALEALGWKVERPVDMHTKNRSVLLLPPGCGWQAWPGAVDAADPGLR